MAKRSILTNQRSPQEKSGNTLLFDFSFFTLLLYLSCFFSSLFPFARFAFFLSFFHRACFILQRLPVLANLLPHFISLLSLSPSLSLFLQHFTLPFISTWDHLLLFVRPSLVCSSRASFDFSPETSQLKRLRVFVFC